ncbi:hypothetical protein QEH45_gp62 [Microbacterium phage Shocker]|uniref:Uncharacterized protein n=1 Tax=Microbacterium phage Shocker TaxID=2805839 RepID=A0A890URL7_9CAUD|nr:hypothetical protein QEH45_gp62 [Microbacterium phage Shocker]QRI45116.1 hypothetical protein SEA_SHOCKER_62 [Microbacterium phage Shocker]
MATVTLPVLAFRGGVSSTIPRDFEIDKLSFTRSITRQGKGARAAWRHQFSHNRFELIPQSHEVLKWNMRRAAHNARTRDPFTGAPRPMHSIRAAHRALLALNTPPEDPWAMIDVPLANSTPRLHTDEQAAPGSDDL